jgi:hypothetical protein
MAKGKGGRSDENTGSTTANGDLLFEEMAEGFSIPATVGSGQWDSLVDRLVQSKGSVVKIFETSIDEVQKSYTRAKQLKAAAKRKEIDLTVAVRKLAGKDGSIRSCVLAQAN